MNKQDIEFLISLQQEMLTQDTVSQADPRFWVVMQEEKEYWVLENVDGIFIFSNDDYETVFEGDISESVGWIKKLKGVKNCKFDVCFIEFEYKGENYSIGSAEDLQEFLDEYDKDNYGVGYYRKVDKIMPDTFFLTNRECKEHIESNKHHYNKTAHSYAMTAWRSPQVERLYKILQQTDWKALSQA